MSGSRPGGGAPGGGPSPSEPTASGPPPSGPSAPGPNGGTAPARLRALLLEAARDEGFELAGIARLDPLPEGLRGQRAFLQRWVDEGRHGEMTWMARSDALERRGDPSLSLPGVRSALVVGHEYAQRDAEGVPEDPSRGVIARYGRGRDYHRVVKGGLERVRRRVTEEFGEVAARAWVDTGPIFERELARQAGLGWFGRNTMMIDPRRGSYFFLGVLLVDAEVEADEPFDADRCGSCRACLDACPTGALLGRDASGAPVMDARLCISYLTIEHRGAIPVELRPLMGNRIYGCDICQEVCPFNVRFAEEAAEPGYAARGPGERPVGVEAVGGESDSAESVGRRGGAAGRAPDHPGTDGPPLVELLAMALDEGRWEAFSRGSAIRRAGRAGFARNVCVAMGNWLGASDVPDPAAVRFLERALSDPEPLVRGHAAWALGQTSSAAARSALERRASVEGDPWARAEIIAALEGRRPAR